MTTNESVAVARQAGAAASAGVTTPTGAAQGVPGDAAGTPSAETRVPDQKLVPEEDLKRLQRTLNQQNDTLRQEIAKRDAYLTQVGQGMAERDQAIEGLRQQILQLQTAGLPEDEAQAARLKDERDRLLAQNRNIEQRYQAALQAQQAETGNLQEREQRREAIALFLNGGTSSGGREFDKFSEYGLTAQDLESCQSPFEMEKVANQKRKDWLAAEKAELARQKAGTTAEARKETGAHTFDRGEATGAAPKVPKPGTPEFREYTKQVKSGQIRLRP